MNPLKKKKQKKFLRKWKRKILNQPLREILYKNQAICSLKVLAREDLETNAGMTSLKFLKVQIDELNKQKNCF
jgi:hypothetical protein